MRCPVRSPRGRGSLREPPRHQPTRGRATASRWAAIAGVGSRPMNARSLAICATLLALIGGGCGGGPERRSGVDPEAVLDGAFSHPIESAEIGADLGITGIPRLGRTSVRLEGPYVSGHGERIPRFGWQLKAKVAGFGVDGELVSTGDDLFLSLYGDNYRVGTEAVADVNRRVAAGFGLRPRGWLGPARYESDEEVAGVRTAHITAPLRGAAVGKDFEDLFARLGLSHPPAIHGTAEGWVGVDDNRLRRLKLDAVVTIPPPQRARLGGAGVIHLTGDVTAEEVGESQEITIPAGGGFKPIRDLFLSLNDLGVPVPPALF